MSDDWRTNWHATAEPLGPPLRDTEQPKALNEPNEPAGDHRWRASDVRSVIRVVGGVPAREDVVGEIRQCADDGMPMTVQDVAGYARVCEDVRSGASIRNRLQEEMNRMVGNRIVALANGAPQSDGSAPANGSADARSELLQRMTDEALRNTREYAERARVRAMANGAAMVERELTEKIAAMLGEQSRRAQQAARTIWTGRLLAGQRRTIDIPPPTVGELRFYTVTLEALEDCHAAVMRNGDIFVDGKPGGDKVKVVDGKFLL